MSLSPKRPTTSTTGSSSSSAASAGSSSSGSTVYNLIMTPINFVTFLLSLVLIDLRYSLQRKHAHSESRSRLPMWLHALLYRPYENDRTKATGPVGGRWYYHTKQKKLFKMEADEAFKFRNTMLAVLTLVSLGGVVAVWYVVSRMFQQWVPITSSTLGRV